MFKPMMAVAAALAFSPPSASFAQNAGPPAAAQPGPSGADPARPAGGEGAAPSASAGQGSRTAAPRQPSPVSRNPNDCIKTGCVDNGGG